VWAVAVNRFRVIYVRFVGFASLPERLLPAEKEGKRKERKKHFIFSYFYCAFPAEHSVPRVGN